MKSNLVFLRRHATSIVAVVVVILLYQQSSLPVLSGVDSAELASHFSFRKSLLPQPTGYVQKFNRAVNPSLERISAWISSVGAAVALNDLDGDGLPNDLCYVDTRIDRLIVAPVPGTGERYEPFELKAGGLDYDEATTAPMGCLPGDYNEDGMMDVLVYYWGRTPIIFLRRQAAASGNQIGLSSDKFVPFDIIKTGERWYTCAATQADLDGDRHMDIVIGNYFQDGARILDANASTPDQMHDAKAKSFNGGWNRLLLWTGASSGTQPSAQFKDVKGVLDEKVARGWTLAVGCADLDGDLLPEIYFANDFGPDRLLHNLSTPGNLRFELLEGRREFTTPASFILGNDSFKGMGVDFGDVNGDGIPDIYVSNITTQFALQESHFLWLSTGQLDLMKKGIAPYRQASEQFGLSRSGWGWDCRLVDFDNDGTLEALQAVGFIKGKVNRWPELQSLGTANSEIMHDSRFWPSFRPGDDLSGNESNAFFVKFKDGKYHDVASGVGLDGPTLTRGLAIADVDGDGLQDFAAANQWRPSYFCHNESMEAGAFLGLHILFPLDRSEIQVLPGHPAMGTRGRPAIGTTVTVHLPDGKSLSAQSDGGSGHSGKRSSDVHFGLGRIDKASKLRLDIKYRGSDSQVHQKTLDVLPGWYTIVLD